MSAPNKGPLPPASGGIPIYDVVWPRVGNKLEVVCLADGWNAYWTHWHRKMAEDVKARSILCTADQGNCSLCPDHRQIWQAYMAVWCFNTRNRAILIVSAKLGKDLLTKTCKLAGFRGMRMCLERAHHRPSSPILLQVRDMPVAADLPSPHEVEPSLAVLFGMTLPPCDLSIGADDPPEE